MIYILSGPVHAGKTTFMKKVMDKLRERGLIVGGFLSESVWEGQECAGYDLLDLKRNKSVSFARKKGEKTWQRIGSYFFLPEGLVKAREIIARDARAGLLVIDEVGPLELAGQGHWPAIKDILGMPDIKLFIVVRSSILDAFIKMMDVSEINVFDFTHKDIFDLIIQTLLPEKI